MNHQEYILPKSYLSYSQINSWIKSPASYRKKYYFGGPGVSNKETRFGKKIAEDLEGGVDNPMLKDLVQYDTAELAFDLNIEGVRLIGYIDNFDSKTFAFREYKTGHKTKSGKVPWTIHKVYDHLQLPIYSLAIQLKFGQVQDICHLDWMETKFRQGHIEFDGHILTSGDKKLELTGRIETFARTITQKERDATKDLILKVAKEIDEDYKLYNVT